MVNVGAESVGSAGIIKWFDAKMPQLTEYAKRHLKREHVRDREAHLLLLVGQSLL